MPTLATALGSIGALAEAPRHQLPEIAFAGRSNVGKSSLLTMLTGLKKLAPVSKSPGRTRRIHFYALAEPRVCLVDLPGHGYAKVSKSFRGKLSALLSDYIEKRDCLSGIVLLIDARRAEPSPEDIAMVQLSLRYQRHLLIAMTKADKLPKSKLKPACLALEKSLGLPSGTVLPVSAQTGFGKKQLWAELRALIS